MMQVEVMMKLFVVGETSPDPKDWSIWSEFQIVIAGSPEQALEMTGRTGDVTEVPMNRPLIVAAMTEPNWGDDL